MASSLRHWRRTSCGSSPRILGLAVSCLLLLTQSREIANTRDLPGSRWIAYLSIPCLVVLAGLRPRITTAVALRRQANASA